MTVHVVVRGRGLTPIMHVLSDARHLAAHWRVQARPAAGMRTIQATTADTLEDLCNAIEQLAEALEEAEATLDERLALSYAEGGRPSPSDEPYRLVHQVTIEPKPEFL